MKRIIALAAAILAILALAGCRPQGQGAAASPQPAAEGFSSDEKLVARFAGRLMSQAEVDFTLKDLDGKSWKLSDLEGKIVLLNFWATWCGPCVGEMPSFQKLYDRFGNDGELVILTVASVALEGKPANQAKAAVSQLISEQKFTFPVLFDADGTVWQSYLQEGIPANYVIDKKGVVRYLWPGAFTSEDEMYAVLEAVRRAESGQ